MSIARIFAVPALLAAASLAGLLVALTGDGWRDLAAWAALAAPLVAIALSCINRTR